ncbi:hypothetical protein BASA81_006147 [Batrachochytrium salamandrivorans]|nr:hypothetical protein BASA81_006147 [Batrachochytrium salamandrivorans]
MEQSDPALERFDRLRVRKVGTGYDDTASAILAEFQSTAANLEPDERIELAVYNGVESLKTVLADPQANKICALHWRYDGKEDVSSIVPLLINNCPELVSLRAAFNRHFAFDFVSSVLEHPSNKLKVLEMLPNTKGDSARFFAALGQSQVSALALYYSPEVAQGLHEYLARDLLVRLKVFMGNRQVPSAMMMSLAKCTSLIQLKWTFGYFPRSAAFTLPKSLIKLELSFCRFVGGFDWSFLAGSNVRELDLHDVRGDDGNQLGSALADYLRAKGLDRLHCSRCDFADETLAKVGVEIGRVKRLKITSSVNDTSVAQIALALKSPNSELRELVLPYDDSTESSIENLLMPALKHPNCNLVKLSFRTFEPEHKEAARRVNYTFCNRLALFALSQGKQVRRRSPCPLRRLPVEMLRLVGAALI